MSHALIRRYQEASAKLSLSLSCTLEVRSGVDNICQRKTVDGARKNKFSRAEQIESPEAKIGQGRKDQKSPREHEEGRTAKSSRSRSRNFVSLQV